MRVIDGGLQAPYVVEARRKAFEEFVKGKSTSGYRGSGRDTFALCNYGLSDYFGPVAYERGMHHGYTIMTDGGDNDRVLLFLSRIEALDYGKTLLPILRNNGYFNSKIDAERVVLHSSFGNQYSGSMAHTHSYDEKERYVLRIWVRK